MKTPPTYSCGVSENFIVSQGYLESYIIQEVWGGGLFLSPFEAWDGNLSKVIFSSITLLQNVGGLVFPIQTQMSAKRHGGAMAGL